MGATRGIPQRGPCPSIYIPNSGTQIETQNHGLTKSFVTAGWGGWDDTSKVFRPKTVFLLFSSRRPPNNLTAFCVAAAVGMHQSPSRREGQASNGAFVNEGYQRRF